MHTLPIAGSFLAFSVAFAAYGCSLDVTGIMPSTTGTGGAGPSSATAGGPGGATATGTSGSVSSAASTTGSGCVPKAEDCENGQDDDCDGLVDCADPDCTGAPDGRECVAPAPSGWTLIAYAPGDTATCPAGSSQIAQVAEAPTSTDAKCGCACDCSDPADNPCEHGTLSVKIGMMCMAVALNLTVTGGCDPLGVKFTQNYGSIKGTPLGVTPIDVPGTTSLPGLQPGGAGTTCMPDATTAAGCNDGGACLPKTTSAGVCIQSPGDVACPPGPFTKRLLVGAPGAVDDQRTCAACTCSSGAAGCANPTFSAFPDDTCTADAVNAPVSANTCGMVAGASNGWNNDDHFVYTATPTGATCAVSGAAPDVQGTIKPQSPSTICCRP